MTEPREDRRTRMSRRLLQNALIEMMKTKSIHEISIKRLCEIADVNRSTFYRYYGSQYDLHREIVDRVSGEIVARATRHPDGLLNLRAVLTDTLEYIEQERELILVLLSSNGTLNIGETFTEIVNRLTGEEQQGELRMYCIQFLSAGLTNIVWTWLQKEDHRSPQEVAGMLSELFRHGVRRAILFAGRPDTAEKPSKQERRESVC